MEKIVETIRRHRNLIVGQLIFLIGIMIVLMCFSDPGDVAQAIATLLGSIISGMATGLVAVWILDREQRERAEERRLAEQQQSARYNQVMIITERTCGAAAHYLHQFVEKIIEYLTNSSPDQVLANYFAIGFVPFEKFVLPPGLLNKLSESALHFSQPVTKIESMMQEIGAAIRDSTDNITQPDGKLLFRFKAGKIAAFRLLIAKGDALCLSIDLVEEYMNDNTTYLSPAMDELCASLDKLVDYVASQGIDCKRQYCRSKERPRGVIIPIQLA